MKEGWNNGFNWVKWIKYEWNSVRIMGLIEWNGWYISEMDWNNGLGLEK